MVLVAGAAVIAGGATCAWLLGRRSRAARSRLLGRRSGVGDVHVLPDSGRAPGRSWNAGGTEGPGSDEGGADAYLHYQTGVELLRTGNPAQAAVRLEKARTREPTKGSIREALGRAYYMLGRWEEAEREFRFLLELSPTNDYAHYCLSRVLSKLGRRHEAAAHLKLARAMRPGLLHYES
ncbi:MAG: hypothetical protein Kow00122_00240 [Thermoleophilia bacterium]